MKHGRRKGWACPHCMKAFVSSYSVARHIQRVHPQAAERASAAGNDSASAEGKRTKKGGKGREGAEGKDTNSRSRDAEVQ